MDVIFSLVSPAGLALACSIAILAGLIKGMVGFAMPMILISGLSSFLPPEIALAGLAPHVQVFVMVELDTHRTESFRTFERTVARMDEITGCWAIGGGYDYLMQVVSTDVAAFQDLMDNLLESPAGLRRYYSYIVTKPVKDLPPALALLGGGEG